MSIISASSGTTAGSRREADSFEVFFESEYSSIVRAVAVCARDFGEAEELVQEAMVRAYLRWSRVSRFASPSGYVYRTAVNLQRTRMRRLRALSRRVWPGPVEIRQTPEDQAIARTDLAQALRRLPGDQRDALMLVEWFGLTSEEAGRLLGIAAGSVRSRVARARVVLVADLDDHFPGGGNA